MEETIKALVFTSSLLLFLFYLFVEDERKAKKKRIETQRTKTRCQYDLNNVLTSESTEQVQKEEEYNYYSERCKTLEIMLISAIKAENKIQEKLLTYYDFNQYGVVINDKTIKRAENELYTAQQKRLRIENQMQTAKRGKIKALKAMNTVN